jgi:hypothetical protein
MNLEKIKHLKLAHPFRRFYLVLQDNERILVDSARLIAVAPDGSRMGVECQTGMRLLWPVQVKDIDMIPEPAVR